MDIVMSVSDLTLVVATDGTILDSAFSGGSVFEEIGKSWRGENWRETVTDETKIKVDSLLVDRPDDNQLVWRQVNHFTQGEIDIPVSYAIVGQNGSDHLIAVGRSMQKIAEEQRRLMNSQLSMERSYVRLQSSEMRYRQIFQLTNEAMLVVDGRTLKIIEANAAASRLFGGATNKLEGRKIRDLLMASNVDVADVLMQAALTGDALKEVTIAGRENHQFFKAIRAMPDGFVMANAEGRIVSANNAFSGLLQVPNIERLLDDKLDNWFDRTGVDCNVLMSNLKKYGKVRRFSTALRGEAGLVENVEISAVEVSNGKVPLYGFVVRAVGMTDKPTPMNDGLLPYSAEQLTGLVGHMSLKDVVRETTSVIERLCIEAALELTGDNRASAAQLLGLSRQSLYDKLGRYGFDD